MINLNQSWIQSIIFKLTIAFGRIKSDEFVKGQITVTPAKAGVHNNLKLMDSRFRGNDKNKTMWTFYETVNLA